MDGGNGGGGDHNNGNDGRGDGWRPERPDPEHTYEGAAFGLVGGTIVGLAGGLVAAVEADDRMARGYMAKHSIVSIPSKKVAIEQGIYDKAVNKYIECGAVAGPMLVLAAFVIAAKWVTVKEIWDKCCGYEDPLEDSPGQYGIFYDGMSIILNAPGCPIRSEYTSEGA